MRAKHARMSAKSERRINYDIFNILFSKYRLNLTDEDGIMMHKNMNLSFPLFDWAMGTSDVKRSLLGTLFNGYDETHIDNKLKPIIEKFKSAKTHDEQVTLDGPLLTSVESAALTK